MISKNIHTFLRFGYLIVIVTFLLMIWVSLTGAREITKTKHPPCFFNSLCTCSKIIPDLGIVRCQDVHFSKIPSTINGSKVFMLYMNNNGLRELEPYFFQSTGLYRLTIRQNPLYSIYNEAFSGLERSLWELDLSDNHLNKVPNRAIRYLQKLRLLNLDGNDIYEIRPENWRGLETSLETLILSNNGIKTLPIDAFSGLPLLETLDLTGNNIREIDPALFRDGMGKLSHLILADNLLTNIPYEAIQPLSALKTLDLDNNLINTMQVESYREEDQQKFNYRISLDELKLEDNEISVLEPGSFQYFDILNKTYLDHNPIKEIAPDAFRVARIRELYIRTCGLTKIDPEMFNGLEGSLEILDLSGNKISSLEQNFFHPFENIRNLILKDNTLNNLNPIEAFTGLQFTLHKIDLSGTSNAPISVQDLKRLRNLRVLSLPRLSNSDLSEEDFLDFGMDLEELIITSSNLKTIKKNAFKQVHNLKKIDFSENSIKTIENGAFDDIGHSLQSLKMSRSFSSSVQKIPAESFRTLKNLKELDLSNNKLRTMPDTSFHFLKKLKTLQLHDNIIEQVYKGTFQGEIHSNLEIISLSFNNIRNVLQHTFVDLPSLEQLLLDDNKIDSLERRSFMNLKNLRRLNLKGNKIATISYEAFQNLPELEDLDMSYNSIKTFEFHAFDQVGTLGILQVNISHNKITELSVNSAASLGIEGGTSAIHSNMKVLDISFNNITHIPKQFFQPGIMSLTHLHMGHNTILNATKDAFGNLPHLEWLDISHNNLEEVNFDVFRNTRKLQVFLASHNNILELPADVFRYMANLRVIDLSHNKLKFLPENIFKEEGLERLDLSHNILHRMPLNSLTVGAASTLSELDLSWNSIPALGDSSLFGKFKSLTALDLSYNRLVELDSGAFFGLNSLISLDLSHNSQLILDRNGMTFQGIEGSLMHLKLDNVSLTYAPELLLPHLITLSLTNNKLPTVPVDMATNISLLRELNLDQNDLTTVPIATHSLKELLKLSISDNPIQTLSNISFIDLNEHLKELDIANLDLDVFEIGALWNIDSLRTLRMSKYEIPHFNIPYVLENNVALRNLEIHIKKKGTTLSSEMAGDLPPKLSSVTFSGQGLKAVEKSVLKGIRNPFLHICFKNTSASTVQADLFRNVGTARDITIDITNNIGLQHIENPSSGRKPDLPGEQFLMGMYISGNKLSCDCTLGWVEVWLRKKRQYICGPSPSMPLTYNSASYTCRHPPDDIRNQVCVNKNNKTLLEVLKADIECGWSTGSIATSWKLLIFMGTIMIATLNTI